MKHTAINDSLHIADRTVQGHMPYILFILSCTVRSFVTYVSTQYPSSILQWSTTCGLPVYPTIDF